MRIWSIALILSFISLQFACGEPRGATPLETFKTYTKAIKKKDTDTMKLLLSDATIAKHESEAKAQGKSLEEILEGDALFNANQRSVEFRDEKIDGDTGTLQVRDASNSWITLRFIREDGVWKIDKQGQANLIEREIFNRQNKAFGEEQPKMGMETEPVTDSEQLPQE